MDWWIGALGLRSIFERETLYQHILFVILIATFAAEVSGGTCTVSLASLSWSQTRGETCRIDLLAHSRWRNGFREVYTRIGALIFSRARGRPKEGLTLLLLLMPSSFVPADYCGPRLWRHRTYVAVFDVLLPFALIHASLYLLGVG